MLKTHQAVKGMNDVLPAESARWQAAEAILADAFSAYGYRQIRMPLVEKTDLFIRSIGAVTDIVEKEMYTFTDQLNGERLTLRPEGTASCLRAVMEHHLLYDGPQRLWYTGPMFRHERPQRGRYRQFHQFGVEALGLDGPDIDAEQLLMLDDLWRRFGLTGLRLEINTLGDMASRVAYRAALVAYLSAFRDLLDAEARQRLENNPLRLLDTKNPELQLLLAEAPQLIDFVDDASRVHFEAIQALLNLHGVAYHINPRLVRGLDYYNRTVFEWIAGPLDAPTTLCGGGRYDSLFEQLGAKPATACGFAIGFERLLLALDAQQCALPVRTLDVYLVHEGELAGLFCWQVAKQLRDAGLSVQQHSGAAKFKSQLKKADQSGALVAVIIGDQEVESGQVAVKPLRDGSAQQQYAIADAIRTIFARKAVAAAR